MNSMTDDLDSFLTSIDAATMSLNDEKKSKKKTKKKRRKLLTVRQPLPYEYYLYVVLNPSVLVTQDDRVIPENFPVYQEVLAIPMREGATEAWVYDPDESSILTQGTARSPSGMSNVENLQIFGDALLEGSRTRLQWEQKNSSSTLRLGVLPAAIGRFNNYIAPVVNADSSDFYEKVLMRRIPYRGPGGGDDRFTYAVVFGLATKGSHSFVFERAWAGDSYTYDIRWSLHYDRLKLRVLSTYVGRGSYPDRPNSTPTPSEIEYSKYRKYHYEFYDEIVLPHSYTSYISGDTDIVPTESIAPVLQRLESPSFEEYYIRDEFHHNAGGNPSTYIRPAIYVAGPPQWEYLSVTKKPKVDISGILSKSRSTFSYEIGSQTVALFGADYNLGNRVGRPRGGTSVYSDLQDDAIASNRYINTNLPMFFADLANAIEDWNNLSDQVRGDLADIWVYGQKHRKRQKFQSTDLKLVAQDSANTYLPLKYGWALTQAEAEQIGQDLTKIWEDVRLASDCRYLGPSRTVEYDVSTSYLPGLFQSKQTFCWTGTIRPQPNSFSGLFAFLDERSLWLTLKDAWDWIPYSFVVNWFTQLPNQGIAWADFQAWKANYDLLEACRSYKLEGKISSPDLFGEDANVFVAQAPRFSYYIRTWNQKFDPPSLNSESSWQDSVRTHWCELGALIVQRL